MLIYVSFFAAEVGATGVSLALFLRTAYRIENKTQLFKTIVKSGLIEISNLHHGKMLDELS